MKTLKKVYELAIGDNLNYKKTEQGKSKVRNKSRKKNITGNAKNYKILSNDRLHKLA